MSSIVGWYSEERHMLMMEVMPENSDFSYTSDFDQVFNESLVFSMRPNQLEKLQKLEQLYGESLDENTRLFGSLKTYCPSPEQFLGNKAIRSIAIDLSIIKDLKLNPAV